MCVMIHTKNISQGGYTSAGLSSDSRFNLRSSSKFRNTQTELQNLNLSFLNANS